MVHKDHLGARPTKEVVPPVSKLPMSSPTPMFSQTADSYYFPQIGIELSFLPCLIRPLPARICLPLPSITLPCAPQVQSGCATNHSAPDNQDKTEDCPCLPGSYLLLQTHLESFIFTVSKLWPHGFLILPHSPTLPLLWVSA